MSLLAYVRERKFKKALQLLSSNDAAAVAEAQARRPPSDSDSSSSQSLRYLLERVPGGWGARTRVGDVALRTKVCPERVFNTAYCTPPPCRLP